MNGFTAYLRERFPLPAVSVLSLGTALLLVGIASTYDDTSTYWLLVVVMALGFVAFLLRTRVTDEFKDSTHDDKNYPDRPVQRGAITRTALLTVGAIAAFVELTAVVVAGALVGNPASWIWYLPVVAYSVLTAFEFFVPRWLARHFTLYFISHQLVFVFFAIWAFALFRSPVTFTAGYATTGFVAAMAVIEIVRKFEIRTDSRGKVVADTYPAVWGRPRTVGAISILTYIVGERLFVSTADPTYIAVAAAAILGFIVYRRSDSAIRAIALLAFMVDGVVAFLR